MYQLERQQLKRRFFRACATLLVLRDWERQRARKRWLQRWLRYDLMVLIERRDRWTSGLAKRNKSTRSFILRPLPRKVGEGNQRMATNITCEVQHTSIWVVVDKGTTVVLVSLVIYWCTISNLSSSTENADEKTNDFVEGQRGIITATKFFLAAVFMAPIESSFLACMKACMQSW